MGNRARAQLLSGARSRNRNGIALICANLRITTLRIFSEGGYHPDYFVDAI